jgi:hypothetical protein
MWWDDIDNATDRWFGIYHHTPGGESFYSLKPIEGCFRSYNDAWEAAPKERLGSARLIAVVQDGVRDVLTSGKETTIVQTQTWRP